MQVEWARMTAPELRALAERDALVVLPVASLEQHGPHLPTMVDTRLATEVTIRAARHLAVREPVVVLPCQWMGMSEHHFPFGGTISLDYATFAAVLGCVARSVKACGFRRLFVVNGHGGNTEPLAVAMRELAVAHDMAIAGATYWITAAEAFAAILDRQRNIQHACEGETAMMMALEPDLVRRDRLEEAASGPGSAHSGEVAGVTSPDGVGIQRFRSFAERVPGTGVRGDPRAATPAKGEALLQAAAANLAAAMANAALWSAPDAVWRPGRPFAPTGSSDESKARKGPCRAPAGDGPAA
ncbi:creatininase family protein [Elioraea sp. Yellowstone]|nr:creatininase family protein [Elioraea sp. Yellowstone]